MTDADLDALRVRAQDLAKAQDWTAILQLAAQLRQDTQFWAGMWAPLTALAARHLGDPSARQRLDEAIAAGFGQPEIFEGDIEASFGGEPDFPALQASMAANIPRPDLELTEWPQLTPAHPLILDEIGGGGPDAVERADLLRERLPAPGATAWENAIALLSWVAHRWAHAGTSHVEQRDALHVLDRVDAGERFACVEYSIVLSQALNAHGIPAHSVGLRLPAYHIGFGRGHVVSEAWLDDLQRWVVLDGQNGMYWVDPDGTPLGLRELWQSCRGALPRARQVCLAGAVSDAEADLWWQYFHHVTTTHGLALSPEPFTPTFEGDRVVHCTYLQRTADGWFPDLGEIGVGTTERDGGAAIRPISRHPHLRGFQVDLDGRRWRLDLADPVWPIPRDEPGDHVALVHAVGWYGPVRAHPLRFTLR